MYHPRVTDAPVRRLLAALTIAAISLASILPVPPCATHDVGATAAADAGAGHEHAAHRDETGDRHPADEIDARAGIPVPPPMPCGGPCAPASCNVVHGLAARAQDASIAEWRLVASAPSRAPATGVPGPARAPEPPPPRS
jgi:hypothetical protein